MKWARRMVSEMVQTERAPLPAALAAIPAERVIEVDVRAELRRGEEPFSRIMAARQQLPPGGALSLRAIFEPAPLYAVLGRQGFEHYTVQHAPDDWQVWFWQPAAVAAAGNDAAADAVSNAAAVADADVAGDDATVVLDVRGLEPPEPMLRTLEALESLPADGTLVQINSRVPQFLLPMLHERGFTYQVREQNADLVRVFIRRENASMSAVRTLDVRVIPPREKHPTIFQTFAALAPGESFVLVNDHDPRPLRYQFEAEHQGEFGWQYLEQGPAVWRVEISRTAR